MLVFIGDNGKVPYVHDIKRKYQEYGLLGIVGDDEFENSNLLDPEQASEMTPEQVNLFLDKDYHHDMNTYDLQTPTLLYTFFPHEAGGVEKDFYFSINQYSEVNYTTERGETFKHPVWNWFVDSFTVTTKGWFVDRLTHVKVERHYLGKGRFVIGLFPAFTVDSFRIGRGERGELEKANLASTERVDFQIFRDGEIVRHLGHLDCTTGIGLKAHVMAAIIARHKRAKAPPISNTEFILRNLEIAEPSVKAPLLHELLG
jgi:hypothetical protein